MEAIPIPWQVRAFSGDTGAWRDMPSSVAFPAGFSAIFTMAKEASALPCFSLQVLLIVCIAELLPVRAAAEIMAPVYV